MYDILIVNDDPATLYLLEKFLGLKGITCKLMRDEREVMKELEQYHPKVILLGDIMPYISGWEICNQIKSNPNINHIPVVLMGCRIQELQNKCKADDYIWLPLTFSELDVIVDLILK